MPIRLCQKCGLKVLIDESQAGTNPFYCQRCTTAMKGQENAPAPGPSGPARNPTPSPVAMANRSDPAAPSVGAAKAATVRVLCPYCKASFNGRVPQKPARGSCPVCQKELILLPNGDIKPAAGFDLGSWQNEPAAAKSPEPAASAEPKESGTRLLVKKYAAESPAAAAPAAKRAEPVSAPADTDVSDENNPLPGWLDDTGAGGRGGGESEPVQPQPETDVNLDVVEPPKAEEKIEEEPPPPPPPPARAKAPIAAKQPSMLSGRPPSAVAPAPSLPPEPEVDLLPPDPPPRKQTARLSKAPLLSKPPEPVGAASAGGETGGGKVFLALFLAVLPLAAGAGLLTNQDKLKSDVVLKLGKRFTTGFGKLHEKLFPTPPPPPPPKPVEKAPEPEPPKEEPPKPDPEQQKKDEAAMSSLYTGILREKRDLKQSLVAATPEQKAKLDQVQKDIEAKEARLKSMQDIYRRMYGKDYDPAKE